MDGKAHWDTIYRTKPWRGVSWFQREAQVSLALIQRVAPARSARIIDVGGGASTLVDGLIAAGYDHLTVLDLSGSALALARTRLGPDARVTWIEADVRTAALPAAGFDVWHDRAVFHFLTSAGDRARYVHQVRTALVAGGFAIVATFAEDGPDRCSGLPVERYSAESLHQQFGSGFRLIDSVRELHVTPSGATQAFVYGLFQFEPAPGS